MEKPRFVETGSGSFFGNYLYDRVVPSQHFLRQLKQIIEWERFTRKLLKLYKGGGVVGRPPFDPALVLKVELIAYLYNLTERQVEVYINENLPAKYFVGLAVDQKAPDHSTLTVFRESVRGNAGGDCADCAAGRDPVWLDPDRGQRPQYCECKYG
jgi:transposase